MQKALAAALTVALTLALAVFTGAALAGGGHGDHGNGGGHGNGEHGSSGAPAAPQQSEQPAHKATPPVAHPAAAKQHGHSHARTPHRRARRHAKPAPAPHPQATKVVQQAPKPSVRTLPNGRTHFGPHAKVYICHSTGSATNPYVLIHVSKNGLQAHTRHHDGRDIVLGDSPGSGCSAARTSSVAPQAPKTLPPPPCVHPATIAVPGYVLHRTGSKTHPWVKIHPSTHSAHYSKHADDVVVPATTRTVMVAADDCSTMRPATTPLAQQAATTAVPVTTTTTTAGTTVAVTTMTTVPGPTSTATTTVAAAVAATTTTPAASGGVQAAGRPTPAPQGGVLGAQATLKSKPKPHSTAGAGVLGSIGGATLPFTGIPLLPVVFGALAALALGAGFRRSQRQGA